MAVTAPSAEYCIVPKSTPAVKVLTSPEALVERLPGPSCTKLGRTKGCVLWGGGGAVRKHQGQGWDEERKNEKTKQGNGAGLRDFKVGVCCKDAHNVGHAVVVARLCCGRTRRVAAAGESRCCAAAALLRPSATERRLRVSHQCASRRGTG